MQLIAVVSILSLVLNLNSVTNQESFLQANQLYQQAQFQAALVKYQKIGSKNSVVWYNMGNCAYHLEQYLEASLFWKRAQLLEIKNFSYTTKLAKLCAQNLVIAQTKIITDGFKIVPSLIDFNSSNNNKNKVNNLNKNKLNSPKVSKFTNLYNFIIVKIQQFLILVPLIIFQLLFLLGLILLGFIGVRIVRRSERIRLMFLLLFLNLVLAGIIYFKYSFMQQEWAMVAKPNLGLQIGPSENYPTISYLKLAEFVKILGQKQQSWYAVQSEDGLQVGWIAADGLTKC